MLDRYENNKLLLFILNTPTVKSGHLAIFLLFCTVLLCALESAYVQAYTTGLEISLDLLKNNSFLHLAAIDFLLPLTVVLLSRRALILYLIVQSFLSSTLLHYGIFFYNPLTLSTIYHSMAGAGALGFDIFAFARIQIIIPVALLTILKLSLVKFSLLPSDEMPKIWKMRGIIAVSLMVILCWGSLRIYGKTGLSLVWADFRGNRTATERRMEKGTWEAVRSIGYLATWVGEFLSGTYKDTELIYAESRCINPDLEVNECILENPPCWSGLPLPPLAENIILLQVEGLDFAALNIKVNGHTVLPFVDILVKDSVLIKAFAPHKVGSSNSDYELLNSRVASQNVMYYSYIKKYPDSVVHKIADLGYQTSVFHGLPSTLFSLRQAYAAQGFEKFYFKEEFKEAGYASSKYIMNHIMDADVLNFASTKFHEDKQNKAQFIITMSSHVPFMDVLPIFKKSKGTFARFISSLRYFDQSFASFYARLPQGTVLIMWGDHGSDVVYPRSFPENTRHVPFIVNIKGNTEWMKKSKLQSEVPSLQSLEKSWAENDSLQSFLAPDDGEPHPDLSSDRIFNLCELSYYLKSIFRQPESTGKPQPETTGKGQPESIGKPQPVLPQSP